MRKLFAIALATVAAAVGVAAVPAVAKTVGCARQGTAVGNIKATNTTCAVAEKVIHADLQGKRYRNFRCVSRRYSGGASVTCKNGKKKVRFQVAD